jgi:shikimate kinase
MNNHSNIGANSNGIIVLLGYMGSGKSTVGRLLSKRLDLPFIDLDQYIETKLGAPIPEIFSSKGAVYFRKKEHECLHQLLNSHENLVLSLGGGAPCYHNNMETIQLATPHTFYLAPSVNELSARLFDKRKNRPLISHIQSVEEMSEFIGKHIFERIPFYEQAQHVIRKDADHPETMVDEILAKLS